METWYSTKNKRMLERQNLLRIQEAAPALLETLELTRNFVYAYSEEDVIAPGLLIKIDAAIAAARGTV